MMFIGSLRLELFIPNSNSLKHRRQVLNSLKDKIKNSFNVSLAEEASDKWQRATLFVVSVSGEKPHLEKIFSYIENMLLSLKNIELLESDREFL